MMIDSHTHLYLEQFDEDRNEMVRRAIDQGVERMLLPNIDSSTTSAMLDLCATFPSNCLPMMGLHPCSVKDNYEEELQHVEFELKTGKYIAVGEIGIDLYWDKTHIKEQEFAFRQQIRWAKEMGLPIVIHARESYREIFAIVDEENDERLKGVFHCFTSNEEDGRHILNYGGFKLGIGGVVTFKNSGLDKTLANFDLGDLVLETDSPYLTPAPFRGQRNESAYVNRVADKLADLYGVSREEVATETTKNCLETFQL